MPGEKRKLFGTFPETALSVKSKEMKLDRLEKK
jgi:hypothetical protein